MRKLILIPIFLLVACSVEAKLRIEGTTCLSVESDQIYHDTDCDGTKDAGEEFIDQTGGSGGEAALSLQEGDVEISSPTGSIDFDADDFNLDENPSSEVNIEISTVSGKFIVEQNTLQTGATFYVSSGTVYNNPFTNLYQLPSLVDGDDMIGSKRFIVKVSSTFAGSWRDSKAVFDWAYVPTESDASYIASPSYVLVATTEPYNDTTSDTTAPTGPKLTMTPGASPTLNLSVPGSGASFNMTQYGFTLSANNDQTNQLNIDNDEDTINVNVSTFNVYGAAASGNKAGCIRLRDADGFAPQDGVVICAPADTSGDVEFYLPSADGTNGQVLTTDGSGNWSFTTVAGGSGSTLEAQDSGTEIDTDVSTMNFTTHLKSTQSASGNVAVYVDTTTLASETMTLTNKTIDATNTVTINASDITDLSANSDITADLEEESHCSEHDSADVDCSGETIVFADNSVDGTDIALGSDAQGDIMYYNGTDWARLGAGTSGEVLHTNGAGANPSWDTDDTSAGGGDNLGTHVATKTLDMDQFGIVNVASMTMIASEAPVISSTWTSLTIQLTDTTDNDLIVFEDHLSVDGSSVALKTDTFPVSWPIIGSSDTYTVSGSSVVLWGRTHCDITISTISAAVMASASDVNADLKHTSSQDCLAVTSATTIDTLDTTSSKMASTGIADATVPADSCIFVEFTGNLNNNNIFTISMEASCDSGP